MSHGGSRIFCLQKGLPDTPALPNPAEPLCPWKRGQALDPDSLFSIKASVNSQKLVYCELAVRGRGDVLQPAAEYLPIRDASFLQRGKRMQSNFLPGAWAQMVPRHQGARMLGSVERQIKGSLSLFAGLGAGVPEDGIIPPGRARCGFARPLGGLVCAEPLLKTCPYKHLQMAFESSRDERGSYNYILSLLSTIS